MTTRVLFAGLLAAMVGVLGLLCGAVASTPRFQLLGFTQATVGQVNPFGFTQACQAEYPQGARVCTAEEAVLSVVIPLDRPSEAWIVGADFSRIDSIGQINPGGSVAFGAIVSEAPVACCGLLP